MGRYKTEHRPDSANSLFKTVMTCGVADMIGANDTEYKSTITDTETGDQATGYGSSYSEADSNAWNNLKN